jgi:queuosine precursor transporter
MNEIYELQKKNIVPSVLIIGYLLAIVAANLLVVSFGPSISIINAFLFIGLDITTRDYLHDAWNGRRLWSKMLLLITTGSALSFMLNKDAGPIAFASFMAFAAAGVSDTLLYIILDKYNHLWRVNGSNIGAAAVDSFIFPVLAFGFPILWWVMIGQFVAKTLGGFLWSIILSNLSKSIYANEVTL